MFRFLIRTENLSFKLELPMESKWSDLIQEIKSKFDFPLRIYRPCSQSYIDFPNSTNLSNVLTSGEVLVVSQDYSHDEAIARALNESVNKRFVPLGEDVLILRESSNDNNCLFHSICYVLDKQKTVHELRELVAEYILKNQKEYNSALLGRNSIKEYCDWILKTTAWGGGIELDIFSKIYKMEIDSVDVQTMRIDKFGEGKYPNRVILVYTGIHYDAIAVTASLDAPKEFDTTVFSCLNKEVMDALKKLIREMNQSNEYTDVTKFKLRCTVCEKGFVGESEAKLHAENTNHVNFESY